jgi:N-methylhydantoinase B
MVRPSAFLIGGGGGYGNPLERAIEEVEDDVRQGYVSVKAAAEFYGVVVDPETLVANRAATGKLRAAHASTAIAAVRHS